MKTVHRIVSTLLGGAALALSAHAHASETKIAYADDGTPTTVVSLADLDLDKLSDLKTLYARVQDAARAVCAAEERAHAAAPFGWMQNCVRSAMDGAVRQVDNEWLTVLHRGTAQHVRV
jgi:UrcA family protein